MKLPRRFMIDSWNSMHRRRLAIWVACVLITLTLSVPDAVKGESTRPSKSIGHKEGISIPLPTGN